MNKLDNKKYLSKIIEKNKTIKEYLKNTLNTNGIMICLTKRNIVYGINILEFDEINKKYILKKSIVLEEVSKENKEKFTKASHNLAKELPFLEGFTDCKENSINNNIKDKSNFNIYLVIILLLGIILGLLFNHIVIGIIISLIIIIIINLKDNSNKELKK